MQHAQTRYAWLLSFVVATVAALAWFNSLLVPLTGVSLYDVFPLFGILAFSVMWTHYIVGAAIRHYELNRTVFEPYFRYTSYGVLVALLLHPGLLILQLQRDNAGLPLGYVAPSLRLYLILGVIAFVTFMLYELHRLYKDRTWWKYISAASDMGMLLVFIHGYKLGFAMFPSWFMAVWVFYGITLILAIGYKYWYLSYR